MDALRRSFNEVAEIYDATRPGYPAAVFDDIAAAATLGPGGRILEIGCGTGQATRGFAGRGCPILAIDPGPELIRLAARNLADHPQIELRNCSFEALPPQPGAFKLIFAAQAWHWVEPGQGFAKAADALAPDGVLAIFGHVPVGLLPASLDEAFQAILHTQFGPSAAPPERWYLPDGPVPGLIAASGRFDVRAHKAYPWRRQHDTASFLALMRSRSDIQTLPAEIRERLLAAYADAIAAAGGRFDMLSETHVHLACRTS